MNGKRILIIVLCLFLLFLGVFTYNQRTKHIDKFTENTGLEFTAIILEIGNSIYNSVQGVWSKYIDLREVRAENELLKNELDNLTYSLHIATEEQYELERLRKLFYLDAPTEWDKIGVRILAGKMGSNAALESIIINKGLLSGVRVNAPAITPDGIVGRIKRAGISSSIVLLATDPQSSIAVTGQDSRANGILYGKGQNNNFELKFVAINSGLLEGETLISSGLDNIFPKGIPIAKVTFVSPSENNPFYIAEAKSLVDFSKLDELVILIPPLDNYLPTFENKIENAS